MPNVLRFKLLIGEVLLLFSVFRSLHMISIMMARGTKTMNLKISHWVRGSGGKMDTFFHCFYRSIRHKVVRTGKCRPFVSLTGIFLSLSHPTLPEC